MTRQTWIILIAAVLIGSVVGAAIGSSIEPSYEECFAVMGGECDQEVCW